MSRPNLRIVSKLTTDVVAYRYCTEASNQKSKYVYRKIFFYKKSTAYNYASVPCSVMMHFVLVLELFCLATQTFMGTSRHRQGEALPTANVI